MYPNWKKRIWRIYLEVWNLFDLNSYLDVIFHRYQGVFTHTLILWGCILVKIRSDSIYYVPHENPWLHRESYKNTSWSSRVRWHGCSQCNTWPCSPTPPQLHPSLFHTSHTMYLLARRTILACIYSSLCSKWPRTYNIILLNEYIPYLPYTLFHKDRENFRGSIFWSFSNKWASNTLYLFVVYFLYVVTLNIIVLSLRLFVR